MKCSQEKWDKIFGKKKDLDADSYRLGLMSIESNLEVTLKHKSKFKFPKDKGKNT